jgi:ATP-dependent DNA helicase DinG
MVSRSRRLGDTGAMNDYDEVAGLLGADGPFAREVPNFAPRAAQQAMARAVAEAIEQRDVLVD